MSETPFDTELAPRPWSLVTRLSGSENHRGYYIADANGRRIAEVLPLDADGRAGGRIGLGMISATDLYAACKAAMKFIESVRPGGPVLNGEAELFDSLRSALAKAEGRS